MKLFFTILALLSSLFAEAGFAQILGQRSGYLQDVEKEKRLIVYEIYIPRAKEEEKNFIEVLFDSKISKEFKQNYERTFGQTESERNYYQTNQFDEIEYSTGVRVSAEEDLDRQRRYGEYMTARLAEYHFDKYSKDHPRLKKVHDVKDRISNVEVKTEEGFGFGFNYSISGNYMDFRLQNPLHLETKLTLQMDRSKFGPTDVVERILKLGYQFNNKFNQSVYYREVDGVLSLVTTNQINPALATSVTASTFVHNEGESQREKLLLLGVSYTH